MEQIHKTNQAIWIFFLNFKIPKTLNIFLNSFIKDILSSGGCYLFLYFLNSQFNLTSNVLLIIVLYHLTLISLQLHQTRSTMASYACSSVVTRGRRRAALCWRSYWSSFTRVGIVTNIRANHSVKTTIALLGQVVFTLWAFSLRSVKLFHHLYLQECLWW